MTTMAAEHAATDVQLTNLLSRAESCTHDQLPDILQALHDLPLSSTRNSQVDRVLTALQHNLGLSKSSLKADLRALAADPGVRVEQESYVARLLRTVEAAEPELWRDSDGHTYATVRVNSKPLSYPLTGTEFNLWLRRLAYEELDGLAVGADVLTSVVGALEARARFDGAERDANVRVAIQGEPNSRTVYLALHDEGQRVVEITQKGWCVRSSDDVPVVFVSHSKTGALPEPVKGGNVADLEAALGVPSRIDDGGVMQLSRVFQWAVAWLLSLFWPIGTRPIVSVNGRQGSGKSDLSQRLCGLVDPRRPQLQAPPRDEEALIISALSAYVIGIDNVSGITPEMADAFARLTSGTSSLRGRKLYSDSEEHAISAQRSVLFNGIPNALERDDLADRVVFINLRAIPDSERLTEHERAQIYSEAAPKALGLLLDVVAYGLDRVANGQQLLQRRPRLADFAEWTAAWAPALGWDPEDLMQSLAESRTDMSAEILENHLFVPLLVRHVRTHGLVTGSATELKDQLHALADDLGVKRAESDVPRTPKQLGDHLRRLADALERVHGIRVSQSRTNKQRTWRLEVVEQVPISPESQWTTPAAYPQRHTIGPVARVGEPEGQTLPYERSSSVFPRPRKYRDAGDAGDTDSTPKVVDPPANTQSSTQGNPDTGTN